jgi:hypothetical protein
VYGDCWANVQLLVCVQAGATPLYRASEKGHAAVVKLLLELKGGEACSTWKTGVGRGGVCMVTVGLMYNC